MFAQLESVSELFQDRDVVRFDADTPTDQDYDLPDANGKMTPERFIIFHQFKQELLNFSTGYYRFQKSKRLHLACL